MKELPNKDLPDVAGGQIIGDAPPYVPSKPLPYPTAPGGPIIFENPDAPQRPVNS